MESAIHLHLKHSAVRFLLQGGCIAAAVEVRCPIARHRVDAAGYLDPLSKRMQALAHDQTELKPATQSICLPRGLRAKTVIVECKQSRSDFLTDSRDADDLLVERARLERVKATLEEQIVKVCEPQLRRSGTRLFAELEEWDFERSRIASYRGVLNDLRRIDERLHGESKFWTLWHYRLADWLYLAAPPGVIRPWEVPPGWGLMELLPGQSPAIRVQAPELTGNPEHRQRLLRNIAVAATRRMTESIPVESFTPGPSSAVTSKEPGIV
ncbi:MAG: hypothetical protein K2W85_14330 [Phycisphaerales bacterium]|nr:hypothetical protein [Phycisphaerales bacterium]